MLKSALTLKMDLALAGSEQTARNGFWSKVVQRQTQANTDSTSNAYANVAAYSGSIQEDNEGAWVTLAAPSLESTLNLDQISVGILVTALENVSFLRAQNGGSGSRLNFSYESLAQQKTNMRAALGRMIDVDVAEESTNLSKYNVLSQAAAAMIAQANSTSELALILLR